MKACINKFRENWLTFDPQSLRKIGILNLCSFVLMFSLMIAIGTLSILIVLISGIDNPPELFISIVGIIVISVTPILNICCIIIGIIYRKRQNGVRCALLSFLGLLINFVLFMSIAYLGSIG